MTEHAETALVRARAAGVLDHVETWIFDLDNTLYPPRCRLFDQVDQRMGAFIADALDLDPATARTLQKKYYHQYGTTLRGLMLEHRIPPEAFLDFVHDIDLSAVLPSAALDKALAALPGRKLVFTNGSEPHARRVLERLGVTRHFAAIVDIVASDFIPKPEREPYDKLVKAHEVDPARAVMVEDIARNLEPAHALGMTTVWLRQEEEWAHPPAGAGYVHHIIDDLEVWLAAIRTASTDVGLAEARDVL